jgi:DNA polymerase-3 subunit alpha
MKVVHLHTHSHYSLLDGLPKVPELLDYAKELGYTALALTDHGNLYGAIEFYKEAKKRGIKPIIGSELYLAPRSRFLKEGKIDSLNWHLTVLAKNFTGYQNLVKLITFANLEGFYYRPRIDKELLFKYKDGLIVLSGCPSGQIPYLIREKKFDEAIKAAYEFKEVFGDDFYIEIQNHPNIRDNFLSLPGLLKLSEITKIKKVATQDSHYLRKKDAEIQDILMAITTGSKLQDPNRLTLAGDDFSFLSQEEMIEKFSKWPDAIENTLEIAEKVNLEIPLGILRMPKFEIPLGETPDSYLRKLVFKGIKDKGLENDREVIERAEYELKIIEQTKFAGYFLVVADIVNFAKENGIAVGPARGSVAGSIVAWLLRISEINPLKYNLLFERFLTPDRVSFPDIDIDFADTRRDEVFKYLQKKYGQEKVAQIITFGTIKSRAAIRDVGRVLSYPYSFCDKLAKMIPTKVENLSQALDSVRELKELYLKDKDVKRLMDYSIAIEGTIRHASVHACGTVIGENDLTELVPLQRAPQDDERIITQYEMHSIEDLGLLKIDLLGLRNLTIIEETKNLIAKNHNKSVEIKEPYDDKKTFEIFKKGQTIGVFQLESSGMRRYLKELAPEKFEDIIAIIALYRPGPLSLIPSYIRRRHNQEKITYLHPKLKDILQETYGIAVYQEQLMKIAQVLAGFTLSEADVLRKAIGKKIPELLIEQKMKMIKGMIDNGISPSIAQAIWNWYEPFARYGFNKSHAVAYAVLAYHTAYLKAHFPLEYMTALFNAEGYDVERARVLIEEAKNMGIVILPPDINESSFNFSLKYPNYIRYGLSAIKNVGENLSIAISEEKEKNGPFESLEDFLIRVKHKDLNKKSLESLIKAGALDRFGDRNTLLFNIETLLSFNQKNKNTISSRQIGLFGNTLTKLNLKKVPETSLEQKLSWEKEYLGNYLSGHPLEKIKEKVKNKFILIKKSEKKIKILGCVEEIKKTITKNGETMLFAQVDAMLKKFEVLVFPKVYQKTNGIWREGRILEIIGNIDEKSDKEQIICEEVNEFIG